MNNELIPVFTSNISGVTSTMVDARLLHTFLESLQDFSTWIKKRIKDYGFVENQDYLQVIDSSAPQKNGTPKTSTYGQNKIDYHITLDMAKELGMIERNEKGRQIRRYFLEMENVAQQALVTKPASLPEPKTKKALPGGLTLEQQDTIKALVKKRAEDLPKEKQAGAVIKQWAAIKNKFGCTYKEISPDNFVNIISLLSRISIEGELVEKQPDQFLEDHDYRKKARIAINTHLDACHAEMEKAGLQPKDWPELDEQAVSGLAAIMLLRGRWLLSFSPTTLKPSLTPVPTDAYVLNESDWIKYMIQERGYVVVHKSELLNKLTA